MHKSYLFHEVHFTTPSLIMVHFVYGRKCFSSIAIVIVVVEATILVRGEGIYMAGIMVAMMSFVWRQRQRFDVVKCGNVLVDDGGGR